MIRPLRTAWARALASYAELSELIREGLTDPFDIPEWPDAPDTLATPYIPKEGH